MRDSWLRAYYKKQHALRGRWRARLGVVVTILALFVALGTFILLIWMDLPHGKLTYDVTSASPCQVTYTIECNHRALHPDTCSIEYGGGRHSQRNFGVRIKADLTAGLFDVARLKKGTFDTPVPYREPIAPYYIRDYQMCLGQMLPAVGACGEIANQFARHCLAAD